MNTYHAIGVMSGSSCDGLDLALCTFNCSDSIWKYHLKDCITIEFPNELKQKLLSCRELDGRVLRELDLEFGEFIGTSVVNFMKKGSHVVDLIASHGHTVFHEPNRRFNLQIGDGVTIAKWCETNVIFDFRTMDIRKGGQGAPLVPAGDKFLFDNYEACLNLGGIANVTIQTKNEFNAFDICAFNQLLNHVSNRLGKEYDHCGNLGKNGTLVESLVKELDQWSYYHDTPGSISNEQIENELIPKLSENILPKDLLYSLYVHFSQIIAKELNEHLTHSDRVLLSGGGAFNTYFVDLLKKKVNAQICLPHRDIVSFKEAIIFAFLGVLRMRNEVNCFSSLTGSESDSSCGTMVLSS